MNLDFLNDVELVEKQAERSRAAGAKYPMNGADIRVFKNGATYPSKELVEEFSLEYQLKGSEFMGNGFDVINSQDWEMYPVTDPDKQLIFIASVDRGKNSKVDLFSTTKWDPETKEPTNSVLAQGATGFGTTLLEWALEIYPELNTRMEEDGYVDLMIVRETTIPSKNGIYYLPKVKTRGSDKGTVTAVRRENSVISPLVPFVEESTPEVAGTQEEEQLTAQSEMTDFTDNQESHEESQQQAEEAGEPGIGFESNTEQSFQ